MNRQAFEAWYQLEVSGCNGEWIAKDEAGQYLEPDTTNAWRAWQAATNAAIDRAEKVCEAIENDKWALYKGRPPYTGTEQGRADNYVQGESDGAGLCANAIRALKDAE